MKLEREWDDDSTLPTGANCRLNVSCRNIDPQLRRTSRMIQSRSGCVNCLVMARRRHDPDGARATSIAGHYVFRHSLFEANRICPTKTEDPSDEPIVGACARGTPADGENSRRNATMVIAWNQGLWHGCRWELSHAISHSFSDLFLRRKCYVAASTQNLLSTIQMSAAARRKFGMRNAACGMKGRWGAEYARYFSFQPPAIDESKWAERMAHAR